MKELNYGFLYNCFKSISDEDIKIIDFTEEKLYTSIILDNCNLKGNSIDLVQEFLGNIPVEIKKIPNSTQVEVIIGKVQIPNNEIKDFNTIKEFNSKKEILFGVTSFGYHSMHINDFSSNAFLKQHSSGSTTLFINLISQVINIVPNSQHIILDTANFQYEMFKKLPNMLFKGETNSDLADIINFINIETIKREFIFKEAFDQSPKSLQEYTKQKDESHPALDPIYVWIDDCSQLINTDSPLILSLEQIAMRSSKIGIYLSTINTKSFGCFLKFKKSFDNVFAFGNIIDNQTVSDYFYSNTNHQIISKKSFEDMILQSGRFFISQKGNLSPVIQSFNMTIDEACSFIKQKSLNRADFSKLLNFSSSYFLNEYSFSDALLMNASLEQIISGDKLFMKRSYKNDFPSSPNPFWKSLLIDAELPKNIVELKKESNQIYDEDTNTIIDDFFSELEEKVANKKEQAC